MKNLKKLTALVLILTLTLCLFAGCESNENRKQELLGTWSMPVTDLEDSAANILNVADFYEEEIALVDLSAYYAVQVVTFREDDTYEFRVDAAASKECVRSFLYGAFADLYEGRASLSETYKADLQAMTEEEFYAFYADLYLEEDLDTLVDYFTDNAFDYETLNKAWETGTYSIRGSKILCTESGKTEAESIEYTLEENTLTLVYANATEVYSKAK